MKEDNYYVLSAATKGLEEAVGRLKKTIEDLDEEIRYPLMLELASVEGILSYMQMRVEDERT